MKKLISFVMVLACLALMLVGCKKDGDDTTETTGGDVGEHVHTWGELEIIEEADCLYDGEAERVCTECGFYEEIIIPKLGHKCDEYVFIENPTFLKDGKQQGRCLNCGKNVREVAKAFKKEYKTVSANLTNVNNVYFNGCWEDDAISGTNGAVTGMLGSEAVAKVTGASKVTYNFKIADTSKSATVAYSLDGVNWTRYDLKTNATLTVSVPSEETVVRVMYVGAESVEQAICLTAVAADKGTVVPCVKDGPVVLTVSDKVDNIEKDTLTLASENLGYTSWRMSASGLGYANFAEILDLYMATAGVTTVDPDYILLDLGANDARVAAGDFTMAVLEIVNDLSELYDGVAIYFVRPLNGAKMSQLETVSTQQNNVSIIDTIEWSATDMSDSSDRLSDFLVQTYGETFFFGGLYDEYNDPNAPVFPNVGGTEPEFGPLKPMN